MRQILILATGLATICAGLSACATPAYPISADEARAPAAGPKSVTTAQVAPPVVTGPAYPSPSVAPDHIASPPTDRPLVESTPLPAVDSRPAAAPQPSQPAAAAPPPAPVAGLAPRVRAEGRLVATGKVVAATRMFRDYQVQKGDHLFSIARDFQTTADQLVEANNLKSANVLRPGQHLKIPIAKAYVAETGDTLTLVAKRFGVGAAELSDLNNLPERGRLRDGDKIALPARFDDHGPFRLAPDIVEQRPRYRVVQAPPAPSNVMAPGPYVASPAALEAGARHLAEERAAESRPPPTPYRPTTSVSPAQSSVATADVVAAGRGRFIWPVKGEVLSPFGVRGLGRKNDGIDVRAAQGTAVHAAASGEVVYSGDQVPGFGNLVLIKHSDGWVTAYAHLDHSLVRMRQTVMQGEEIGQVGLSGGVTEPQLHFEVRYAPRPTDKARPIDPQLVLPK